jgi:hypothetical protein
VNVVANHRQERHPIQQLEAYFAEPGTDHDRVTPGSETAQIRRQRLACTRASCALMPCRTARGTSRRTSFI